MGVEGFAHNGEGLTGFAHTGDSESHSSVLPGASVFSQGVQGVQGSLQREEVLLVEIQPCVRLKSKAPLCL